MPPYYLVRYTLFLVLMATWLYCDAPFVVQVSKSLLSLHTWFDGVVVPTKLSNVLLRLSSPLSGITRGDRSRLTECFNRGYVIRFSRANSEGNSAGQNT